MTDRLPAPERSRAVLIGSSAYRSSELPDLPAVSNNLDALVGALTDGDFGGFLPERCRVIPRHDLTELQAIFRVLRRDASDADDTLLVYFAGHGLTDVRSGELYLALGNTEPSELPVSALAYKEVRSVFLESRATNRILILDCCYSGRATEEFMTGTDLLFGQLGIEGTYVLTAAAAYDLALAPANMEYTAFTGALVDVLRNGIPAGPELLPMNTVYERLFHNMTARNLPRPTQRNTGSAAHLALVRNPALLSAPSDDASVVFLGARYGTGDRRRLAGALAENWSAATRRFFGAAHAITEPAAGTRDLRKWLGHVDVTDHDDNVRRTQLVDTHLADPDLPPEIKLLRLLAWLDPDLPPTYRGIRLLPSDIPAIAERSEQGDPEHVRLVKELAVHSLLPILASLSGGSALRQIDTRWRSLAMEWNALLDRGEILSPQAANVLRALPVRSFLLRLAAAEDTQGPLRTNTAALLNSMPDQRYWPAWLRKLVASAHDDPLRLLAIQHTSGIARQEADDARLRRQQWARADAPRKAGRVAALAYAVFGATVTFAVPCVAWLSWLLLERSDFAWPVAAGIWGSQTLAEGLVAWQTGRSYHPDWSLLGRRRRRGNRVRRGLPIRFRIGCPNIAVGCPTSIIGIYGLAIAAVFVVSVVSYLVQLVLVVVAVGSVLGILLHWSWTLVRLVRWHRVHGQARAAALERHGSAPAAEKGN